MVHQWISIQKLRMILYEAYWYYIGRYGCDSTINLLNVLQDHGTFIKDKS